MLCESNYCTEWKGSGEPRIFFVRLVGETEEKYLPSGTDWQQEGSEWVSLEQADRLPFFPKALEGKISGIVSGEEAVYLGSGRM